MESIIQSDESYDIVDIVEDLEISNRFETIEPSVSPELPELIEEIVTPVALTEEVNEICCICSDSAEVDMVKTHCGHNFHLKCILDWNVRQSNRKDDTNCPICRQLLHKHTVDTTDRNSRIISTGHRPTLSALEQQVGQLLTHFISSSSNTMQSDFIAAISNNNIQRVNEIINLKPNIVNSDFKDGMKPIHHCLYQRQFHLVDLLISKGANVKTRNSFGVSTLMIAVIVNSLNTCRKLINKGAEIESCDNSGDTALFYAVRRQYTSILKLLLSKGANVNHANYMGMTVFQFLAANKDYSNNVLSIMKRTDPTCLMKGDNTGDNILHTATENNNVRFLHKFKDKIDITLRLQPNYLGDLPDDYIDSHSMEEFYDSWQSTVNIVINAEEIAIDDITEQDTVVLNEHQENIDVAHQESV
jgi:hypothetical protein